MKVFVDTGYYYARIDRSDQRHAAACRAVRPGMIFVTSNLVVNETVALLQRRRLLPASLTFLRELRTAGSVELIHIDAVLQAQAWELFHRWSASGATPVDCSSFAVMRSLAIRKAFSFDTHFRDSGFEILR